MAGELPMTISRCKKCGKYNEGNGSVTSMCSCPTPRKRQPASRSLKPKIHHPKEPLLYPLPNPADVVDALRWLQTGSPAVWKKVGLEGGTFFEAKDAVKTLIQLVEALPGYFELYSFGSKENVGAYQFKAMHEREAKRKR